MRIHAHEVEASNTLHTMMDGGMQSIKVATVVLFLAQVSNLLIHQGTASLPKHLMPF
ncbi:hypothetical protein BD309DRAFT_951603 [Dichomitus squalens]|uniref:Uncharacterized protein n=1 Tax=Dichomitus squalens TaxID=114155 RepID=A0A4Q9PTG2_9APHY|nr:hypothetical protein BD311DRAFT_747192 [Dichomitus squalens]TBU47600.1 hypothetical protein BD309DRAFT_951603 [Dichomitus squalens]TBU57743.1 hypothetical protein BD310DRAFT_928612 [Dichomitus squalens]